MSADGPPELPGASAKAVDDVDVEKINETLNQLFSKVADELAGSRNNFGAKSVCELFDYLVAYCTTCTGDTSLLLKVEDVQLYASIGLAKLTTKIARKWNMTLQEKYCSPWKDSTSKASGPVDGLVKHLDTATDQIHQGQKEASPEKKKKKL